MRPTDDELCSAARTVFLERGFEDATMGELASAANTTRPTLYAHFGDKVGVFRAVMVREALHYEHAMGAVYDRFAHLELEDAVEAGVEASFDFAMEQPETVRLLLLSEHQRTGILEALEAGLTSRLVATCLDWCDRHQIHLDPDIARFGCALIVAANREAVRRSSPFGEDDPAIARKVLVTMTRATFSGLVLDHGRPIEQS